MTYEEICLTAEKALPKSFELETSMKKNGLVLIGMTDTSGVWRGTYVTPEEITSVRLKEVLKGVINSIGSERK